MIPEIIAVGFIGLAANQLFKNYNQLNYINVAIQPTIAETEERHPAASPTDYSSNRIFSQADITPTLFKDGTSEIRVYNPHNSPDTSSLQSTIDYRLTVALACMTIVTLVGMNKQK